MAPGSRARSLPGASPREGGSGPLPRAARAAGPSASWVRRVSRGVPPPALGILRFESVVGGLEPKRECAEGTGKFRERGRRTGGGSVGSPGGKQGRGPLAPGHTSAGGRGFSGGGGGASGGHACATDPGSNTGSERVQTCVQKVFLKTARKYTSR